MWVTGGEARGADGKGRFASWESARGLGKAPDKPRKTEGTWREKTQENPSPGETSTLRPRPRLRGIVVDRLAGAAAYRPLRQDDARVVLRNDAVGALRPGAALGFVFHGVQPDAVAVADWGGRVCREVCVWGGVCGEKGVCACVRVCVCVCVCVC